MLRPERMFEDMHPLVPQLISFQVEKCLRTGWKKAKGRSADAGVHPKNPGRLHERDSKWRPELERGDPSAVKKLSSLSAIIQ